VATHWNGSRGNRRDVRALASQSWSNDTLICWLGAFTLWMTGELEMRLKTIQIRLAGMSDQLNALSGRDPEQGPDADLILELNDW